MNVIRTILIIVLVYYALKFIARIAFPFLLKYFVNKAQQNMQSTFNQAHQHRQEGETNVKNPNNQRHVKQVDAEDVDFEEVD